MKKITNITHIDLDGIGSSCVLLGIFNEKFKEKYNVEMDTVEFCDYDKADAIIEKIDLEADDRKYILTDIFPKKVSNRKKILFHKERFLIIDHHNIILGPDIDEDYYNNSNFYLTKDVCATMYTHKLRDIIAEFAAFDIKNPITAFLTNYPYTAMLPFIDMVNDWDMFLWTKLTSEKDRSARIGLSELAKNRIMNSVNGIDTAREMYMRYVIDAVSKTVESDGTSIRYMSQYCKHKLQEMIYASYELKYNLNPFLVPHNGHLKEAVLLYHKSIDDSIATFLPLELANNTDNHYKCIIVDCGCASVSTSMIGYYLYEQHPDSIIVIQNTIPDRKYKYSLRKHDSLKIDLSDVARHFGGGGHYSSAGFITHEPIL